MTQNNEIESVIEHLNPWAHTDHTIWMMNVLSLSRNLSSYHFPHKLNLEQKQEVVGLVGRALAEHKELEKTTLIASDKASAIDKEFLYEHFFSPQSFTHAQEGEAFVIEKKGRFLGLININNHLELIVCHPPDGVTESLNTLIGLEASVGATLDYAFSPTFGFMTSNPMHCGTGLSVRMLLQLPALVHTKQLNKVLGRHRKEGVHVTGLTGNTQEFVGDLAIVSNVFALGLPEEKILQRVRTLATHLMVEEKSCRSSIKKEESAEIKDAIGRAFGLLKHSYTLETFETFNALSLVKLGLDLGWLKGVSIQEINELFFHIRRGHFTLQQQEEIAHEQLSHQRSSFVQKALQPLGWST